MIDKNIRTHPIILLVVITQLFFYRKYIKNKLKKEILFVKKQKMQLPIKETAFFILYLINNIYYIKYN